MAISFEPLKTRLSLTLAGSDIVNRTVCLCGCPLEAHENYGEDGEGCAIDNHACVRLSPRTRDRARVLIAQIKAARQLPPSGQTTKEPR
jgi:hypothetical protein